MRRSWKLWTGVALCIAVTAVFFLLASPPEFEFLAGKEVSAEKTERINEFIYRERMYSFRGDFKAITNRAVPELTKAGYQRFKNDKEGMAFYKGPPEEELIRGEIGGMPTLAIWKDAKWQNLWGKDPAARGWITVVTVQAEEESTWTKIRSWFGL